MAFNNGFPVGYPQMYYPQQYQYQNMQTAQMPVNQQSQMMTPPTIHAEIIQVDDEAAVDRFPMAAGATQMFGTKDERFFFIKQMFPNGQYNKVCYERKDQQPEQTPHYVTWEELEQRLAEMNTKPKREKEEKHNEPV